ncbi:MAG: CBS domain-containing protein, partial [Planctomycetia bacterium]
MKNTGIQSQIINATPTSYKNLNKTKSGATTLGYVVLLGFTIIGGIAAYYGVAYNSNLIFEQEAILQGNNTQTMLLGLNTSATQLALVSSITVMAGTLLFGGLFLRSLYRKPKAEPSADDPADEVLSTGTQQCLTEKRQQMRRLFLGKVKSSPGFEPQVQHLMSKNVMTVLPQKPAEQISKMMDLYRVRHLLVCDKDKQLCGIISDRDLRKRDVQTAADLM